MKHVEKWLKIAKTISDFSTAKRKKVGAVIVNKNGIIIGTGYNGTPSGVDNSCESNSNITHEYVIHAEMNAIFNASTNDLRGAVMFITDSPCIKCASAILQKQIKTVYYTTPYRLTEGIDFLISHGVEMIHVKKSR